MYEIPWNTKQACLVPNTTSSHDIVKLSVNVEQ